MGRPKKRPESPERPTGPALRAKVRVGENVIGPGKVRLLRLVDEHGSITAAAGAMGINYRRAWFLLESLQRCFAAPLFVTSRGGGAQGGAQLTALGKELVERFAAFEMEAAAGAEPFIDWIAAHQADEQPA